MRTPPDHSPDDGTEAVSETTGFIESLDTPRPARAVGEWSDVWDRQQPVLGGLVEWLRKESTDLSMAAGLWLDVPGPTAAFTHAGIVGSAAKLAQAADTIERLQDNLGTRDDFLVRKGLFMEFADQLPGGPERLQASTPRGDVEAPAPALRPGGIDFGNWSYNAIPEHTGNPDWRPDLQDLIYTAINHVMGDYEDADDNCAEQVIERLVLAIKGLLSTPPAAEVETRREFGPNTLGVVERVGPFLRERASGGGAVKSPSRPLLRWHGGKWLLAPWIISHFPPHRIYVEPFGGAASVLLRKRRSYAEVYNDLDDDVVNLFEVVRSARGTDLVHALIHTPFARVEFENAYLPTDDPLERARRLIIRSFMGFGSDGHNGARPTGFRANSNRSGTTPAHDWENYPDHLDHIISRVSGLVIEHRPAIEVMAQHDGPKTLHYVDPPYVGHTRSDNHSSARKNYAHELSEADHAELLRFLKTLKGAVVLSGYSCSLYEGALSGWTRVERASLADGARKRTEVLWINPACAEKMPAQEMFPVVVA